MGIKRTLVFEVCLDGHRLEYLHHIYMGACDRKNESFTFVVPEIFNNKKKCLNWPKSENIHFHFIPRDKAIEVESAKSMLKSSYLHTCLLKRYAKEEDPDQILLISLMAYMPWLALARFKDHSIRGIIYRIYLYEDFRGIWRFMNKIMYQLFAHRRTMDKIYTLNDVGSAKRLNDIYQTANFYYLPDPVPSINKECVKNVRQDLGIKPSDKMYLHFGGLSERKGTLVILEAITKMNPDELSDKVFVFAGVIYDRLKERFYALKKTLDKKARIIVYDEYCPYALINDLCESCDVILIPYQNTSQSSGVIGYASFFNKPVIGPSRGLLGRLVKEYDMGATLDEINADSIRKAVCKKVPAHSCNYHKSHTVSDFTSALLS